MGLPGSAVCRQGTPSPKTRLAAGVKGISTETMPVPRPTISSMVFRVSWRWTFWFLGDFHDFPWKKTWLIPDSWCFFEAKWEANMDDWGYPFFSWECLFHLHFQGIYKILKWSNFDDLGIYMVVSIILNGGWYPHSWMMYKGKSENDMDDDWGYSYFRKLP